MNKTSAILLPVAAAILLLTSGCSARKTVHQRPWIGGEFVNASRTPILIGTHGKIVTLPKDVPKTYKRGIVVKALEPETPMAKAGVQEGDLLLSLNGQSVANHQAFYKTIGASVPGAKLPLQLYRAGKLMDVTLLPGVERYKLDRTVMVQIGASTRYDIDLLPDPNFSLIALGFKRDHDRLELNAPLTRIHPPADPDSGTSSHEGWRAWVGPLSIGATKRILSQEAFSEPIAVVSSAPPLKSQ